MSTTAGELRDLYGRLDALRDRGEVVEGTLATLVGAPAATIGTDTEPHYVALSYDTVTTMLRDHQTFSSAGYAAVTELVLGPAIIAMDEPEHHARRALVQQAFRPRAMERWEHAFTAPIVHRAIDRFAERGHADLMLELTLGFPIMVIAEILGLPDHEVPSFHERAIRMVAMFEDPLDAAAAADEMRTMFKGLLDERRRSPRDDVVTDLCTAEVGGERLSDDEIESFLLTLLPAGAETTYRGTSNLLFALLSHPDQLAAVRADRSLVPRAVEEGLRWECSPTAIGRTTTRETELGGVRLPAGAGVSACLAAANHDPNRWDRPGAFDIFRSRQPHVAFATGVHMCLGMHLARMEMAVALRAVLDRLPELRLDPAATDPHIAGVLLRTPNGLPVRFEPVEPLSRESRRRAAPTSR